MNEEKQIIAGSPMAWLLAARPKTLAGAAVPVMIGLSMAFADGGVAAFRLAPAILWNIRTHIRKNSSTIKRMKNCGIICNNNR